MDRLAVPGQAQSTYSTKHILDYTGKSCLDEKQALVHHEVQLVHHLLELHLLRGAEQEDHLVQVQRLHQLARHAVRLTFARQPKPEQNEKKKRGLVNVWEVTSLIAIRARGGGGGMGGGGVLAMIMRVFT